MHALRKCPFFLQNLHVALRAGHGACLSWLPPHLKHPLYLNLKFWLILELLGFLWRLWDFWGTLWSWKPVLLLGTECVSLIFISLLPCVIAFIWAVALSSVLARSYICWKVSLFPRAIASFQNFIQILVCRTTFLLWSLGGIRFRQ